MDKRTTDFGGLNEVRPEQFPKALGLRGWFQQNGAYVLVDGQYGSTGKGLMASWLAEYSGYNIDAITTNAGPNSGHTAYWGDEKIVTTQIPIASVILARKNWHPLCYLNAGAILNYENLDREMRLLPSAFPLYVSPWAAVIDPELDYVDPAGDVIASTNKGTGPALARKHLRQWDAVVRGCRFACPAAIMDIGSELFTDKVTFVETAQGYSLGINQGFYPFCTSRATTVAQALADAKCPPKDLRKSIVVFRCHPIRVGNTEKGHSGNWYPDQVELTWEGLGQTPELTTVTKRERRIASFSWKQFGDALRENSADAYCLNFLNYLPDEDARQAFIEMSIGAYEAAMGKLPDFVLLGYGPRICDVGMLA